MKDSQSYGVCHDPKELLGVINHIRKIGYDSSRWNIFECRRQGLTWNASIFRTANRDDIMFISSGPLTNTGHFENVGDTLRQGIELGASGVVNAVRWGVAYSLLRARFDTPLTLSSPNHPDEEDGEIEVEAGSRIPGVPQHNLKANLSATIKRLNVRWQSLDDVESISARR